MSIEGLPYKHALLEPEVAWTGDEVIQSYQGLQELHSKALDLDSGGKRCWTLSCK